MCGINGFNFKDTKLLLKMNEEISYRGPDDTGIFEDEKISLGHNRLSIIDLSELASQPMASNDQRFVIVFNGEIYNYKDLKKDLKNSYSFKTESDTEIILAAYDKWGYGCVKKFNGIFALAIWDRQKQELFLARDHLGVKPLYYYYDGSKFIFSSEIKAILQHPISRELNRKVLNIYFRLLYIPEPLTSWHNVFKLPPAHFAVLTDKKLEIHKFWEVTEFDNLSDKNEIRSEIKKYFKQAVNRQLISDKPLGLYLSGGIDSTVLLGVMSDMLKKPINTFTVGFEVAQEQQFKFNADYNLAKRTSKFFRSNHSEIILKARDVQDNFEKIVWHADDLVANHTQPAMYVLSGLAKQSVDVVLSGDGGDELFGGYDRYYLNSVLNKIQYIPEDIRKNTLIKKIFKLLGKNNSYKKLNLGQGLDRFSAFMMQKEDDISIFLQPEFNQPSAAADFMQKKFFHEISQIDSTKLLQYLDLKTWLLDDALNRADRMSMAHGIEQRVPLLDKELVELAMNIPSKFNLDNKGMGKKIFRESLKEYIPEFVYDEPKRGWFSPMAKWLRGDLKDWAYEILSPGYNRDTADYLNFTQIRNILDGHISGSKYALNTIWPLITFQVWFKRFMRQV